MTIHRNPFDPFAPEDDSDSGIMELRSVLPPGMRRRGRAAPAFAPAPRRAAPAPAPAPRRAAPAPAPAPRRAAELRQAAIDATKRVYLLGKRWENEGQFDEEEIRAAAAAAVDASGALRAIRPAVRDMQTIDEAADAAARAAYGIHQAEARLGAAGVREAAIRGFRDARRLLADLGVDVEALDREAAPRRAAAPAPVAPRRAGWARARAVVLEGAQVEAPPERVEAALAQIPRGDAWLPRDDSPAPNLGPTPVRLSGTYKREWYGTEAETYRKLKENRSRQWAEIMRFAPRTAVRLGIADQVRAGKLDNYLGSGGYASAFALPNGQILKLTVAPDDAFILWRITQEGRPLPGLIDVYSIFRIELPFDVDSDFGNYRVAFGVITERVSVGADRDNISEEFKIEARRQGLTDSEIKKQAKLSFDALNYAEDNLTGWGRNARAEIENARDNIRSRLQMINEGAAWCDAHDVNYWSDFHPGNYAVSARDGQIVPVKNDIGQFREGFNERAATAELRRGVPLAKNRRVSRYKAARKLASNRRTSRGRTSSRRTSRGRFTAR